MMNKKGHEMDLRFLNATEVFEMVKAGEMSDDQFLEWLAVTVQDAFYDGAKSSLKEAA
jgi:hypothetical protein